MRRISDGVLSVVAILLTIEVVCIFILWQVMR